MSTNRATWFFNNKTDEKGWSITLWDTDNTATLDTTGKKAFGAAKLMCKLLGPNVLLDFIRVSNDEINGDSQVLFGVAPPNEDQGFVYNKAFAGLATMISPVAFNLRCEAGDKYRGPIYFSGAPGAEYQLYTSSRIITEEFQQALNTWINGIIVGGKFPFALKVLPKKGDGAAATVINNIVFTAQNNIVVTSNAHGLASGNKVRINKVQVDSGRFSVSNVPVLVVDANTFKITTYKRPLPGPYIGGGFVQNVSPIIVPLTRITIRAVTTRKRGRPFGLSHGKGPKKAA